MRLRWTGSRKTRIGERAQFNALAGCRSFLTDDKKLALVVEYNNQRARLSFSNLLDPRLGSGARLSGNYEANARMSGVAYYF
jgi:hypothetical protein